MKMFMNFGNIALKSRLGSCPFLLPQLIKAFKAFAQDETKG